MGNGRFTFNIQQTNKLTFNKRCALVASTKYHVDTRW